MRVVVALLVVASLALAACGGDDEDKSGGGSTGGGSTTAAATPSTPSGAILAFYQAAVRGDSAAACALIAPKADPSSASASLLIAGTGSTAVTTEIDCESTVSALYKSHPNLLRDALPKIRTTEAGAPEKLDISRSDSGFKYHATLVKVGDEWRILEVVV
jgi:hypothetical protein